MGTFFPSAEERNEWSRERREAELKKIRDNNEEQRNNNYKQIVTENADGTLSIRVYVERPIYGSVYGGERLPRIGDSVVFHDQKYMVTEVTWHLDLVKDSQPFIAPVVVLKPE